VKEFAMAKRKRRTGGPFIAAAVLCHNVTEDSDGVMSAIRIVDQISMTMGPDAPAEFPSKSKPLAISFFALIIIRKGDAPAGKHRLGLVVEQPDGETEPIVEQDIEMPEHPNGVVNMRIKLGMKLSLPGVHWIDVNLDEDRLTRMALNLVIARPQTETTV
jgi:hypothetical protein